MGACCYQETQMFSEMAARPEIPPEERAGRFQNDPPKRYRSFPLVRDIFGRAPVDTFGVIGFAGCGSFLSCSARRRTRRSNTSPLSNTRGFAIAASEESALSATCSAF